MVKPYEGEIMNLDFDKYYEAPEPGRRERAYGWATAIGLQDVDGLKPSQYLISLAKENIEGRITIDEVIKRIDEHYEKLKIGQEHGTPAAKAIADLHRYDDGVNDGVNRQDDGVNGGIRYALTETEEKAAKAILRDSHITATVLSIILSVKKRHAERIIASLKKKAGLKRRGADKNGEWYFEGAAK